MIYRILAETASEPMEAKYRCNGGTYGNVYYFNGIEVYKYLGTDIMAKGLP